jgi:polysaccharide pyruvyl transferase WcaK-like protein
MKVCLLGDNRTAGNFGSIATTEALRDILLREFDLSVIDYRYIHQKQYSVLSEPTLSYRILSGPIPHPTLQKVGIKKARELASRIKRRLISREKRNTEDRLPPNYSDLIKNINKYEGIFETELKIINESDILLVNSEGALVNGRNKLGLYRTDGRYLLSVAFLAKKILNKKVVFANCVVDPELVVGESFVYPVLSKVDHVYTRDRLSLQKLKENNIHNCDFLADSLFSQKTKPIKNVDGISSKDFVVIGDSATLFNVMNDSMVYNFYDLLFRKIRETHNIIFLDGYSLNKEAIVRACAKHKIPVVSLQNTHYTQIYDIMNNAICFISGRWHASIMALMTETPIVSWGSDSHKVRGLFDLFDLPSEHFYDVGKLYNHIDDIRDVILYHSNSREDSIYHKIRKTNKTMHDSALSLPQKLREIYHDE